MSQAVSLSLFRYEGVVNRLWAFAQMGTARFSLPRTPGIGTWKLCGSGTGEGFTPVPNLGVYAILATWPDPQTARDRVARAPVWQSWRKRAAEDWTVFLTPTAARGKWAGEEPFKVDSTLQGPALAALTRATVKPSMALKFWGQVPNIEAKVGANADVAFKIGIGEVPLLHQVTFSIWPNERAMAAFARTGPHAEAIRHVRDEGWFKEELYARFAIHSDMGTWNGTSPLKRLEPA